MDNNDIIALMQAKEKLQKGWETAFADDTVLSDENYRPQFVLNNMESGQKVLTTLET